MASKRGPFAIVPLPIARAMFFYKLSNLGGRLQAYVFDAMMHGVASLEAVPVPGTSRGRVRDGDGLDSSPKCFNTGGFGQRYGDVFARILGTNWGWLVDFCPSPAISESCSLLSLTVSTTTLNPL